MDDKVLEELEFHQDTLSHDVNSPLHLIREKEMEISGRVLAAKNEAEGVVAAARKKAAELMRTSEEEGKAAVATREKEVLDELDKGIAEIKRQGELDVEALRDQAAGRVDGAVSLIVRAVTEV